MEREIIVGKEILNQLNQISNYFGQPPKIASLCIPSFSERSEGKDPDQIRIKLENEAEQLRVFFSTIENDGVCSLITPAASPHTPETIPILINGKPMPAHLIVWWWGRGKRVDLINLSRLDSELRKKYLEAISQQIKQSVSFLFKYLPEDYQQKYSKWLEIYGLVGHANSNERKKTGLSRGAQSHPEGHINIVFHPYDKYREKGQKEEIDAADFLKHVGVMDTILMKKWGDFFTQVSHFLLKSNDLSTSWELKHALSNDQISFYEGLRLNFYKRPINLNEALENICQVISFYDQFYQLLKSGFENYWKNIGNENKKTEIISKLKHSLIEKLRQIGVMNLKTFDDQIDGLVDFTLSFKPTYQQLKNWEQDESVDESSRKIISRLKNKYEKRRERLKSMTNEEKKAFVDKAAGFYGVSSIVAESLVLMIKNQIADPANDWKNIKFTWPNQLSLSYMIEDYEIDNNGEILVKKITIAPRFMTEKGTFEDMAGMIIRRCQGV